MKTIDEQTLMAYLDGELDAAAAQQVRAAINADPQLAARADAHRQLGERLQAAYRPLLDETVPERLLRAARGQQAAPPIDLAAQRAARRGTAPLAAPAAARTGWARWGGIAASLLVGVLLGQLVDFGGGADFETTSHGLVARGSVAQALSTRLASAPVADQTVGLQISFVDRQGDYCRTFTTSTLAGLACRDGDEWTIQTLLNNAATVATEMRQAASGLPPELLQAVDLRMDGGALDAQAERAALQRRWAAERPPLGGQ